MKTQTTKRATRRIAASLAIAAAVATSATLPTWAAQNKWTGAVDSDWSNKDNWNQGYAPAANKNDWVMLNSSDAQRQTIILNGIYVSGGGIQMNNIGTAENPLTFRADPSTASLQFGASSSTMIANYDGDSYVLLESGSYSTGGKVLYLGPDSARRTFSGHLIVDSNASLTVEDSCQFSQASSIENRGEIETKNIRMLNVVSGKTSTFIFNGGTLKAMGSGTIVSNSNYLVVNATANGGTIDANGKAVEIEEAIADASGETGAMTFKGGGLVTLTAQPTYTGVTTVEVGTALVVPSAITGNKLAFTIPEGIADGVYEVVRISGGGAFDANVLDDATLPSDASANFFLNSAKTGIYCLYGEISGDGKVWVGIAGDGKLSSAENWIDTTQPANGDVLNFSAATGAISLDADLGAVVPSTLVLGSKVVTISSGSLTVETLTNACTLAVASGASLTVTGDLVAMPTSASDTKTFLNSNEGTVTVGGKAVAYNTSYGSTTVLQYETASVATQPIRANGIDYSCSGGGQIYMKLQSKSGNKTGSWVVGPDGLSFPHSRNAAYSTFWAQSAAVTLYSSANWTLANTGKQSSTNGDLYVPTHSGSSLTIDTSDYVDSTVGRTVTLNGRIVANNPVTIKGCGTVEVNTTGSHAELPADLQHTCLSNATLSVTGTATLKINEGRKITGNGTISLAAGTTLAVDASALGTIGDEGFTPCIPGLALPAEGKATIRIDGARLRSGDHVIGTVASGTNVTLDPASSALDGRDGTLRVEDGQLILNVQPNGLMVIFR